MVMSFGGRRLLTHFNRPVEILELHIKPADFFTANPALDVPGNKNIASVYAPEEKKNDIQPSALSKSSCCVIISRKGTKLCNTDSDPFSRSMTVSESVLVPHVYEALKKGGVFARSNAWSLPAKPPFPASRMLRRP